MSQAAGPDPELDPYFAPEIAKARGKKGSAHGLPLGDAAVRWGLLPAEAAFRVAGTAAMLLAAVVFVAFAVPVSLMLQGAGDAGGLFHEEPWLWRRWAARMASVLTLAAVAAVLGWGLRHLRPWARWAMVAVGLAPPLAFAARLALRALGVAPPNVDLDDPGSMLCVGAVVLPACAAALWCCCSAPGRAVLSRDYAGLVGRTPKLAATAREGRMYGLALALALFILFWTLLLMFLGTLAACGIIRSV